MEDKDFQFALAEALKILSVRSRSVADLTTRLSRKLHTRFPEEQKRSHLIERVLERLKEYGYINDERLAEQLIQGQLSRQPVGRKRLTQHLIRQQIEPETIQQTLQDTFEVTSEAEVMEQAISKHIQRHGLPTTPQASKRLLGFLLRRGFPYGVVINRLQALLRTAKLQTESEMLETTEFEP